VVGWLADPVDAEAARLAAGANLEHRVRWRLRNLLVADESVTALVEAWRAGAPPPGVPEPVVRDAGRRELEHSERLARVHRALRERDRSAPAAGGVRTQNAGDDAYLQGDREAAFAAFMRDLTDSDPAVWSGLALVAPYSALKDRPEVVRAMWLALGKSDLPSVADWLSRTGR
jgi:hypothetical protein